jgi:hypothetical protein
MFNFPFKLLGWIIKASLFAAVILILGNVLHIGGKTVSDQVKTSLSHAEQVDALGAPKSAVEKVKNWSGDLVDKTKRAAEEFKKPARHTSTAAPASAGRQERAIREEHAIRVERKTASEDTPVERPRKPVINHGKIVQNDPNSTESILASERQELRTLIRELNSSTEKLTAN